MNCEEAAEFVSALYDGETIPRAAAEHLGACEACQARMRAYIEVGVELRRVASLELPVEAKPRLWVKSQQIGNTWWQKGWETIRIPRLAFAAMIAGIVFLASTLAVVKVGARSTGTVVLLSTAGPNGPLADCPLSTQDTKQACDWYGRVGSQSLAYRVRLLSREGGKVLLAIHTRTYSKGQDLSSFTQDADSATKVKEVWFEPGQPLKLDVTDVGTLTLKGEWMDHMPIIIGQRKQDLSPGSGEIRIASPLLLKDNKLVGDLVGSVGGVFSTNNPDWAMAMYIPGQGRFLIAQVQLKGAVEAHVALSRITFEEGGHSWVIANGVPVSSADHIWVLHQPDFKASATGQNGNAPGFGNQKLVQTASGEWVPTEGASN
jgi:hypothetical protein